MSHTITILNASTGECHTLHLPNGGECEQHLACECNKCLKDKLGIQIRKRVELEEEKKLLTNRISKLSEQVLHLQADSKLIEQLRLEQVSCRDQTLAEQAQQLVRLRETIRTLENRIQDEAGHSEIFAEKKLAEQTLANITADLRDLLDELDPERCAGVDDLAGYVEDIRRIIKTVRARNAELITQLSQAQSRSQQKGELLCEIQNSITKLAKGL